MITIKQKFKHVYYWWMTLDPSTQYMYWIISLCSILFSGMLFIVTLSAFNLLDSFWVFPALILGIFLFISLFSAAVLFFSIYYPFHLDDFKINKKNH